MEENSQEGIISLVNSIFDVGEVALIPTLPPVVTRNLLFILDKLAIFYCYDAAVNVRAFVLSCPT